MKWGRANQKEEGLVMASNFGIAVDRNSDGFGILRNFARIISGREN